MRMFQLYMIHFDKLHSKTGDELGPDNTIPFIEQALCSRGFTGSRLRQQNPSVMYRPTLMKFSSMKSELKKTSKRMFVSVQQKWNRCFIYIYLFAYSTLHLFIYIFIYLFVCSFVCLFVCLFVRLFVCLFVRSFVCLFICLFVCLFVFLWMQ